MITTTWRIRNDGSLTLYHKLAVEVKKDFRKSILPKEHFENEGDGTNYMLRAPNATHMHRDIKIN